MLWCIRFSKRTEDLVSQIKFIERHPSRQKNHHRDRATSRHEAGSNIFYSTGKAHCYTLLAVTFPMKEQKDHTKLKKEKTSTENNYTLQVWYLTSWQLI
jgi:hypothetical protein